jgi:hypothetical protein
MHAFVLRFCRAAAEDRVSAAYLKCDTEMDVSVPPYLLSNLTVEGEFARRLAR